MYNFIATRDYYFISLWRTEKCGNIRLEIGFIIGLDIYIVIIYLQFFLLIPIKNYVFEYSI